MVQSDKQERIVFSVKLQAERWNEHCLQRSVNFVAASRPDSPDGPLARSVDWRKFCVGQRIDGSCNWKIVGIWRWCSLLHVGITFLVDPVQHHRVENELDFASGTDGFTGCDAEELDDDDGVKI